jgi:hypothetical protein
MAQQWRIGISGKQRKDVNINLLIQAVIALGEQLRDETQRQHQNTNPEPQEQPSKGGNS